MAGILEVSLVAQEPVSLAMAKNFLKINTSKDDGLIGGLISAARLYCEGCTGLYLASRNFVQYRDALPTFPFLPNPYSPYVYPFGYPLVTNYPLWNYGGAQPMKPMDMALMAWPVTAVDHIEYLDLYGDSQKLEPDEDFIVDLASMPARISPCENQTWPMTAPVANALQIFFTAGFGPVPTSETTPGDTPEPAELPTPTFLSGIPQTLILAIMQLVNHWYFNRDLAVAGGAGVVPHHLQALIDQQRVFNWNPIDTVNG